MAKTIPDTRLKTLAAELVGSTENIYTTLRPEYEVNDETFDRLREAGVIRCATCGVWTDVKDLNDPEDDFCPNCIEGTANEADEG